VPIPTPSMVNIEVQMQGLASAGGSNNRAANFKFHYIRSTISNPFIPADIEAAFQATIAVPILAALNLRYAQTFNTVRCIDDASQVPYQFPRAVAGSITGDSMPMFCSAYVLFRTSLRGRSYRGSKHFFPLSESDTTVGGDDVLNAGAKATWATAISAMLTGFTDSNSNIWVPSVFAKKLSQDVLNPTSIVNTQVTSILLNARIGRMKKRERSSVY
jgi:hypothetical protein